MGEQGRQARVERDMPRAQGHDGLTRLEAGLAQEASLNSGMPLYPRERAYYQAEISFLAEGVRAHTLAGR